MIQTQLLKLDPPYQIITARGYVGIQVATLIVTEERSLTGNQVHGFSRSYTVFHSYPVVNYGLKQGLEEQLKYNNSHLDDMENYKIRRRMQPEGAVWDGVDVKDVRVLGLAGAQNDAIDLTYFVYLIPTARGYDPQLHVWDNISSSRIFDLYTGLGNVGLRTQNLAPHIYQTPWGDEMDESREYGISLSLEKATEKDYYFIKVLVKSNSNGPFYMEDDSAYFRCVVCPSNEKSVSECAATIAEALQGLSNFLPTRNLKLEMAHEMYKAENTDVELLKILIAQINENYKNLR